MSQVLPPAVTIGEAGAVGLSVVAGLSRRGFTPPTHPAQPSPLPTARVSGLPVDEDAASEWDPASVAQRGRGGPVEEAGPIQVTLGQLRQLRETGPRRPVSESGPVSGSSLAASAISRMWGGAR